MLPVYIITLGVIAELGYYYITIYRHLTYTTMLKHRYSIKITHHLYENLIFWTIINTICTISLLIGIYHEMLTYRYALFLFALLTCIINECAHHLYQINHQKIKAEMKIK